MFVDGDTKEKNKPYSKNVFQIIAEQVNKSAPTQAIPVPSSERNNTPNEADVTAIFKWSPAAEVLLFKVLIFTRSYFFDRLLLIRLSICEKLGLLPKFGKIIFF